MACVAAPSGLDERPSPPIAPRRPRPSGRKNAHRGLAACRRAASGQPCSQALTASGKNRRLPTTARRSHLLQQSNPKQDPRCHAPLGGSTVSQNAQTIGTLRGIDPNGYSAFVYWLWSVAPGGQWDYKVGTGANGPYYDMMGNFNFGATGIVLGLSPTTILSGAGLAQLASPAKGDGGIPFIQPPYADDQKGQSEITAGMNGGC